MCFSHGSARSIRSTLFIQSNILGQGDGGWGGNAHLAEGPGVTSAQSSPYLAGEKQKEKYKPAKEKRRAKPFPGSQHS